MFRVVSACFQGTNFRKIPSEIFLTDHLCEGFVQVLFALTPEGDWGCSGRAGAGVWSCQSTSVEPQDLSGAVLSTFTMSGVVMSVGVLERGYMLYIRVFFLTRDGKLCFKYKI